MTVRIRNGEDGGEAYSYPSRELAKEISGLLRRQEEACRLGTDVIRRQERMFRRMPEAAL